MLCQQKWCKKITNEYKLNLFDIINKIKSDKIFKNHFVNFEKFITLLHDIRKLRNDLFHLNYLKELYNDLSRGKLYEKEFEEKQFKGIKSLFIFQEIKEKLYSSNWLNEKM